MWNFLMLASYGINLTSWIPEVTARWLQRVLKQHGTRFRSDSKPVFES